MDISLRLLALLRRINADALRLTLFGGGSPEEVSRAARR